MTDRRPRPRRWLVAAALLSACLCALLSEREVPAVRRRLSQLLRGATVDSAKQRQNEDPQKPQNDVPPKKHKEAPKLAEAIATVPLHATAGTHHAHLYIGSPPQRQTLIVDTGSRLMAFPCHPCKSCGTHASQYFDPSISTTDLIPTCGNCFRKTISACSTFSRRCVIEQKYTEGSSWSAFEMEDVVWFGTASMLDSTEDLMELAVPYAFGCQTSERGLFRKQYADGILGLASHESSFIHALHVAGAIPRNAFSLCFTQSGGHLSLGGIRSPSIHHLEPMKFSPIVSTTGTGMYSLSVEDVFLGNSSIFQRRNKHVLESFAAGKGTIIDSGTTDTFLPQAVASIFTKRWKALSGMDHSNEPSFYSFEEFQRLPEISIQFRGNVTLIMTPESYMEGVPSRVKDDPPSWKGKRELTNRIYVDEPHGAVLGANVMYGYDILFDAQAQRVGLARADCSMDIGTA